MPATRNRPQSRLVFVNGLNLHLLDWGTVGKRPLVMIHGVSGNAHNFDPLAPLFRGNHHVLALDLRGRGDSDWAKDKSYEYTDYVADLDGLLGALTIERPILLGVSMGGAVAMAYAGTHPEKVSGLVLNDIGPEVDSDGLARVAQTMGMAPEEFANIEEVMTWMRDSYPVYATSSDGEMRSRALYAVRKLTNGKFGWKYDKALREDRSGGANVERENLWPLAKNITCPILAIRGEESDIFTPRVAARMLLELPQTRVVEVPGVGHAPTLLEPEALVAIREYLN